jgi:hypothetical protein
VVILLLMLVGDHTHEREEELGHHEALHELRVRVQLRELRVMVHVQELADSRT